MKLSHYYAAFLPLSVQAMPRFLFAGQSNMEGHVGTGSDRFNGAMDILLDTTTTDEVILTNLKQHLYAYSSSPETSTERYDFMAEYLVDLKNQGLLTDDIQNSQADIDCSFYEMDINDPDSGPDALAVDVPLSPDSGCGKSFGPELMFGHVMKQQFYGSGTRFALDKIAAGGSEIEYHWSKDIGDGTPGKFWGDLVGKIQDIDVLANDYWAGIAWFQGENAVFRNSNSTADSFSQLERDEVAAKVAQYEGNLLEFVRDVRQEVYDVDPSRYPSPDVIPFAIIQLGCWIREYNDNGLTVFTAQQAVADNDPNVVLVDSYRGLSCHYHYDDPSQLIIGHRLAVQMQTLLNPNSACNFNGVCEEGEECNTCQDCILGQSDGAICGDGVCQAGNDENCVSCPEDCNGIQSGKPSTRFCCGDGGGSSPVGCSDGRCGNYCTDTAVPAVEYCCGNNVCEVGFGESCSECALDCEEDAGCSIPCGNNIFDDGEECDGSDFFGKSCADFGCTGGTLACGDCVINSSSCTGCTARCTPTHDKEKGPRCSDGIDNDCDGLIDGDDPDCQ